MNFAPIPAGTVSGAQALRSAASNQPLETRAAPVRAEEGLEQKSKKSRCVTTASERIYGRFFDAIVGIVTLGVCVHATFFGKPNQTQGRL